MTQGTGQQQGAECTRVRGVQDRSDGDVTKQGQLRFGECWPDSEYRKAGKEEQIQVFFSRERSGDSIDEQACSLGGECCDNSEHHKAAETRAISNWS